MRIVLVALMIALLAMPASARGRGGKTDPAAAQQSAEQKKKAAEQEKAYKNALDQIPVQKPADPWAKMR